MSGVQSSYNTATATTTNSAGKTIAPSNMQKLSGGVGVVTNVASIIGDFYGASLLTSSMAGSNVGDVGFSTYSLRFDYYNIILRDEELRIIDDYFTRFGYKVNKLKIPEFTSRTYWNYVKIAEGENIGYGAIPSNAMDTINGFFRSGVSIWHNHENLGNFALANW